MKFCCHLAFGPTAHLVPMARAIEEAGYDTIAPSDHVVHPETVKTKYPYTKDGSLRWEPFTDWPDPWVSVGAMAAVTSRVRFVTGVDVLPMRNPFVVAKAVGTAAAISNDRVTLGIGTGWMRDEFELLEQPFERRGKRTDEMIAVLRTLWSGGMVEHHGEFYDFGRLEMSPVPSQPIPIVVGGLSERALRRAAMLGDGWFSDLHTTDELRGYLGRLRAYRADCAARVRAHAGAGVVHGRVRPRRVPTPRGHRRHAPRDQAVAVLRRCGERPRVEDRGAEALRRRAAAVGRASGARHRRLARLANPAKVRSVQVNILEAKNQLSRLVKAAAAGREIVIASNGKPMAKLVPLTPRRRLGGWRAIELSQAEIDAAFTPEVEERVARSFRSKR